MKWLSATAVFTAALPTLIALGETSVTLNRNKTGTSVTESKNDFTQVTDPAGTIYTVDGDITFSNYNSVPPPPKPTTPEQSTEENDKASTLSSPQNTAVTSSTPHSHTAQANSPTLKTTLLGEAEPPAAEPPQKKSNPDSKLYTQGGAFRNPYDYANTVIATDPDSPGSLTVYKIVVPDEGGGIYSKGPLTIEGLENLTFSDNSSQKEGGAIFCESTTTIADIIDTITFKNNSAVIPLPPKTEPDAEQAALIAKVLSKAPAPETPPGRGVGGAVSSKKTLLIEDFGNMKLNNNVCSTSGGAFYSDSDIIIQRSTGSTFANENVAGFIPPGSEATGDKEEEEDTETTPKKGCGGVLYTRGNLTLHDLDSAKFSSNKASKSGGAIYTEGSITISGDKGSSSVFFSANKTNEHGGGVYSANTTNFTDLSEIKFLANTAGTPPPPPEEGAESVALNKQQNGSLKQKAMTTANLSAGVTTTAAVQPAPPEANGGGLYSEQNITVSGVLSTVLFQGNTAYGNGGGAYAKTTFNCDNSRQITFTNNKATKCGGGLYSTKSINWSNLSGTTSFSSNTAGDKGGGLYVNNNSNGSSKLTNIETLNISGNQATSGGGVYTSGDFIVTFDPSTATILPPAPPYSTQPPVTAYGDVVISNNKATTISGETTKTSQNNKATNQGGGIYAKKTAFSNLNSVTISGNSSELGGGICSSALGNAHNVTLPEKSNYILYKSASSKLLTTQSKTNSDLTSADVSFYYIGNVSINSNTATDCAGGVIGAQLYFGNMGSLSITGNSAQKSGGALFSRDKTTITGINNVSVSKNTSKQAGGAIYAKTTFSLGSCTNVTFSQNSVTVPKPIQELTVFAADEKSGIGGGAIFGATVTLASGEGGSLNFTENIAKTIEQSSMSSSGTAPTVYGGAVCAKTALTLKGSSNFTSNSADQGGAVASLTTATLTGSHTFSGNKSLVGGGGAIYAIGKIDFTGGASFTNNSSTNSNSGSAIHLKANGSNGNNNASTITANATVLFENNTVAPSTVKRVSLQTDSSNTGAAIFGEKSNGNGSGGQTPKLTLFAQNGDIIFRNNAVGNTSRNSTFRSIGGDIDLTLKADKGSIYFYDPISTKGSSSSTCKINDQSAGSVIFSSKAHANESTIGQNVTLAGGTLVLDHSKLTVTSFNQTGGTLVMGAGSELIAKNPPAALAASTHDDPKSKVNTSIMASADDPQSRAARANGDITITNLIIDISELLGTNGGQAPKIGENGNGTVTLDNATITIVDPNGDLYQNPKLGKTLDLKLVTLPSGTQANNVKLEGDLTPLKGYMGTWTLDSKDGSISADWKFDRYQQWAYVPRESSYYLNTLVGARASLIAVKQNVLNNCLSSSRFDDPLYNVLWTSAVGTILQIEEHTGAPALNYKSKGYVAALDAKPNPDLILGAAFSQMFGKTKTEKVHKSYEYRNSEHSYQTALYAGCPVYLLSKNYRNKRPVLWQGILSYAYMKQTSRTFYPSIWEKNLADWHNRAWVFDSRLTFDFREPDENSSARLSAFLECECVSLRQSSFLESDYNPRKFDATSYRYISLPVGFSVEGTLLFDCALLYNKMIVSYTPSIFRNEPMAKYQVLSDGTGGVAMGNVPPRNTARLELHNNSQFAPCWSLYGSYTMEAGENSFVQMLSLGSRMVF